MLFKTISVVLVIMYKCPCYISLGGTSVQSRVNGPRSAAAQLGLELESSTSIIT